MNFIQKLNELSKIENTELENEIEKARTRI